MSTVLNYLRRVRNRQVVRPWALATPVLVLLVALPLLRPLQQPDPYRVSDDEMARLATVQAIVEHQTMAIDQTHFSFTNDAIMVDGRTYSGQMPVLAFLLSGSYWLMYRWGVSFSQSPVLVPYLLTLIGVTLPVALGTGLVYRMGRIFELRRPWRMGMAMAAAFATGMISYAVVLNGYAPAGALLLAAAACLLHAARSPDPSRTGGWLAGAGFCAALAGVIELAAAPFAVLMMAAVLGMRLPVSLRVAGVLFYMLGAAPPIVLHAVLMVPVTGNLWPGHMHPQLAVSTAEGPVPLLPGVGDEESAALTPGLIARAAAPLASLAAAMLGARGVLSHFPVILLGLAGIFAIMHRHWPGSTKALACASAGGGATVLLLVMADRSGAHLGYFAIPAVVLALPLILFWAGAWLRKPHHPATWTLAAVLLVISMAVSLAGATAGPHLPDSPTGHSALANIKRLLQPAPDPLDHPILAER